VGKYLESPRNKTRVTGVYLHVRLACALLFLAWLPAAFGQQRSYSFTGHLVFPDGSSVAGAEIEVATVAYKEAADPVLTDGQGRFAFAGLPAGLYVLSAHRNDLGEFRWGQTPDSLRVDAVNLNEKVPPPDIVFRIERYATIVGVVRDAAGNPAPNFQVSAARRSWANGKAAMRTTGYATTDDLGRFRIHSVARGRYRVCVYSMQGGVPVAPVGYATFGQSSREVYCGACVPDARSKGLLDIAPGQSIDLDVVLSPQTLVTVSGKVANAPDVQGFMVQLQPSEPSSGPRMFYGQAARDTHAFQIANVPPGRYWLTAQTFLTGNGVETPLAARVPVTVGDSPVSDLEVTLAPLPAIDVAIHAPSDAGEVTVGLRDADDPVGVATNAQRQADGALRIALQHGGRYWLAVRTPLCPSAARLGKAEALYHAVEIAPGMKETLDVTITHACGDIRATAVDGAGKPVPKARMLILMSGTPDDPGDYDLELTGEDGAVSYIGMTPGKYPIWAWSDADDWNGAIDDLGSLKARQTVVEVGAGQKADVRVPLVSAAGQAGQ
jgi:hypothetical protein